MKETEASSRRIRRLVDEGGHFFLTKVRHEDGSADGVLLDMIVCDNLECPCQSVTLVVKPTKITSAG
jgi:hypothetical protein